MLKDFRGGPEQETVDTCTKLYPQYLQVVDFHGVKGYVEPHVLPNGSIRFADDPSSRDYDPELPDHPELARHELSLSVSKGYGVVGMREPLAVLNQVPRGMSLTDFLRGWAPGDGEKGYYEYSLDIRNGRPLEDIFRAAPMLRRNGRRQTLLGTSAFLWIEDREREYGTNRTAPQLMSAVMHALRGRGRPITPDLVPDAFAAANGYRIDDIMERVDYLR